jgi:ankyrin repeat protein
VQSTLAADTPATHIADAPDAGSLLARVKAGDACGVADLLSQGDAPDAERDACGRTPLLWAADGGNAELVALLLAAGADVNAADEDGSTPVLHAALCGHEFAARALLHAGADMWARDAEGCCAADVRPAGWSDWWPVAD